MKTLVVLFSLLSAYSARAENCHCGIHNSPYDFSELLQTVALAKGPENRFVYPEFKTKNNLTDHQFEMLTSGDLAFFCDHEGGGASVVTRGNLVALDAHAFLNYDASGKCTGVKSDAVLKTCEFRSIDKDGNLGSHPYRLNPRSLQLGDQCAKPDLIANDWAVVELTEMVDGATPYSVFDISKVGKRSDDFKSALNLDAVTTSAINTNFKINGEKKNVPTLCRKPIGHFEAETDSTFQLQYLQTTGCGSGVGNSGSGVKVPMGDRPAALAGIVSLTKNSSHDFQEYGPDNFTAGPLVEGKFAAAIASCQFRCPPRL